MRYTPIIEIVANKVSIMDYEKEMYKVEFDVMDHLDAFIAGPEKKLFFTCLTKWAAALIKPGKRYRLLLEEVQD